MKFHAGFAATAVALALGATGAQAQSFTQGFNTPGTLPTGWTATNVSTNNATGNPWNTAIGITDASGAVVVGPYEGAAFAVVNYTSIGGTGAGTINNWLVSPTITGMKNGDTFSFFTTTTPGSSYPDRMEFRLSTAATASVGTTVTGVGTFTTSLLSINPTLAVGGYPQNWTQYTVTLSGLTAPVTGNVAFRYFVTNGGTAGANSNIIGVDQFSYVTAAVPEPATYAMLFAGLGAIGFIARRRQG